MRFGLTVNPRLPKALQLAREMQSLLHEKGEGLVAEGPVAAKLGLQEVPIERMEIDVLLAIGGDGTILRALQKTATPILGINTSLVGFLTEVPGEGYRDAIARVLRGDYRLEERMKLAVTLEGSRLEDCTNEALLHSNRIGRIRHFHVTVDGQRAWDLSADAIMVATATGSTGYSLSAGGPLVDPRVEVLVLGALAPFKLAARPTVVPASSEVVVTLVKEAPCVLILDGQGEYTTEGHEEVLFTRSGHRARFIRFTDNFYDRLNERLVARQGLKLHGVQEEKSQGD